MLPFPHTLSQARVAPVPVVPRQIGSLLQVFEQPVPSPLRRPFGPEQPAGSPTSEVPQSQVSPASTTPFPQEPGALPAAPPAPAPLPA
jgi:hypothetical protein